MNSPSDTIQGSPTFHYILEKLPDGSGYSCRNHSLGPQVPVVTAETEQQALTQAKAATEAWMGKGSGTQR